MGRCIEPSPPLAPLSQTPSPLPGEGGGPPKLAGGLRRLPGVHRPVKSPAVKTLACRTAVLSIVFVFLATVAGAQGIQVTIDRADATIRDRLMLRVKIEGSQNAQPRLPDLSPFQVIPRGAQRQVNMVNGRTTLSVTHNYMLVPQRTGTFTIGAASVEIDDRTYNSRPFSVRIVEASATPRQSDALFIQARVSNDSPYVGEQVIYTWRFYRRVQVQDAQLQTPFEFEGFLVEDLGEVREYNTTRSGQEYLVSEIKKALFPQEEGKLTLPATQLKTRVVMRSSRRRRGNIFEDFFGRTSAEDRMLNSPAIEVDVRPLPAAPSGYSGLVGDFKVAGRISKRALQVGESATWKLTVSGTGNVQMIGEPTLPELGSFKTYDEPPTSSIERSGAQLRGSRSYSTALVPLTSGELTVPAVRLTYFDPEAGSYRTAQTAPVTLSVLPAEGKEELRLTESVAPTTGKVAVRILADDILPIYKDLDAVATAPFGHRADGAWFAGLLAPPFAFFGLLFVERRRRHLEFNVEAVRRRSALKKALKGLDEVAKIAKDGQSREAAVLASRRLREYVGDKVALEGSALTPAEVGEQLNSCGVEDSVVGETRERLERLEAAQYAGDQTAENEDLAGELRSLLKTLERQIRR